MSLPELPATVDLSVPIDPARVPRYRLFSTGQILAASLLGSFVAGAVLYAIDQRRLGEGRRAWLTIGLAVFGLAALCLLIFTVGEKNHAFDSIGHVSGFALWRIAKQDLGPRYEAHLGAGGERAGNGWVALLTIGTLTLVLGTVGGVYLAFGKPFGDTLNVDKSHVYYTEGVKRAEAQKVADALVKTGFLSPEREADVQLRRDSSGLTLVLVHEWTHPTPVQLRSLQTMSDEVNEAILPLHVELAVADSDLEITAGIPSLPRELVGQTRVYYLEGATSADARTLVDTLVKATIITTDKRHMLELRRDGDGYAVSMSLEDGAWDRPKLIDAFKVVAGIVSRGFDGKPVHYRLCDENWTVKRTVP